jgi:hypothetical protein
VWRDVGGERREGGSERERDRVVGGGGFEATGVGGRSRFVTGRRQGQPRHPPAGTRTTEALGPDEAVQFAIVQ